MGTNLNELIFAIFLERPVAYIWQILRVRQRVVRSLPERGVRRQRTLRVRPMQVQRRVDQVGLLVQHRHQLLCRFKRGKLDQLNFFFKHNIS